MSRLPNGWASRRERVKAAYRCLRGDSVIFNGRWYLSEHDPVRVSAISPGTMLYVMNNLIVGSEDDPPTEAKVVFGNKP